MASLDLTMVLKLNDKATRQMQRFNRTLDQTKKKLLEISKLQAKTAKSGALSARRGPANGAAIAGLGTGAVAGGAGLLAASGTKLTGLANTINLIREALVVSATAATKFTITLNTLISAAKVGDGPLKSLGGGVNLLEEELDKVDSAANRATANIKDVGEEAKDAGTKAKDGSGGIFTFKNALIAMGAAALFSIKGMISTGIEFEKLRATLKAVLEPGDNVNDAFAFLESVAQKLPATMQEVTTSFIRMQQLGLKPTEEKLLSFGETAARSGKTVLQFVEAVADAAVGENERLKEFGIKAKDAGDKVAFTFKGVTTEVDKTSSAITNYLVGLGKVEPGQSAAENQMETLGGKISNLGVAWDGLSDSLTEKFNPAMKLVVELLTDLVDVINGAFKTAFGFLQKQFISLFGWLDQVALAFTTLTSLFGKNADERAEIYAKANAQNQAIRDNVKALHEEIDAQNEASDGAAKFKKILDDRAKATDKLTISIDAQVQVLQKYNDFRNEIIGAARDENRQLENAIRLRKELNELLEDGLITQEVHDITLRRLDDIINKTSEWSLFQQRAFENMQDDLADFFGEAMTRKFTSFKNAMEDLAASFARTISKMVAQWLAAKILTGGFGLFGLETGQTRGFAAGGRPPVNVPSIVGESGPEIFVPDTAGTIIPNDQMMGGNTVHVNITAMDSQDVMRSLEKNKRGIAEMVFGTSRTYNLGAA